MKNEVKCNKRLNAIYFGWEQENSIFFLRFLSLLELQIMVHVVNENQLWKKSVQIKMVKIMKIEFHSYKTTYVVKWILHSAISLFCLLKCDLYSINSSYKNKDFLSEYLPTLHKSF